MAKVQDYSLEIDKFKLQSSYYIYFWIKKKKKKKKKGINLFILPVMG